MARLRLGLKSSTRDIDVISALRPAFLETYLFSDDISGTGVEGLAQRFGSAGLPVVIHVPEYYDKVFIDLASSDKNVLKASMEAVRLCIKLADELGSPHIVLHPGGVAERKISRPAAIKRLKKSMHELSYDRFYLENMPWFYFRAREKGGQVRHVRSNIMIDVEDYAEVLDLIGGMTLDICHGFLSNEEGSMKNLLALFDSYPGLPRYLHLSDARPPDGEGLQLGEGSIQLGPVLDRLKGKEWWGIPEIMDGQKQGGKGFAKALLFLRDRGL